MSEEKYESFSKEMSEKYPEFFGEDKHFGGFAIGEGWYPIINTLAANMKSHLDNRAYWRKIAIEKFTAREQGMDALIKYMQGKSASPSDWDIERAERCMNEGVEIPKEIPPVIVQQIKEKFGGLRFYFQGGDDVIDGMVRMAEAWADASCETCGNLGKRRQGGWVRTLCDKHEEEYQNKWSKMKDEDGDQE